MLRAGGVSTRSCVPRVRSFCFFSSFPAHSKDLAASVRPLQCLTMDLTVAAEGVEGVEAGEAAEGVEADEETETTAGAEPVVLAVW